MPSFEMCCEKKCLMQRQKEASDGLQCVTFHGERIVGASFFSRLFLLYIVLNVHNIYRAPKFLDSVCSLFSRWIFCNNMCMYNSTEIDSSSVWLKLFPRQCNPIKCDFSLSLHKVCVVKFLVCGLLMLSVSRGTRTIRYLWFSEHKWPYFDGFVFLFWFFFHFMRSNMVVRVENFAVIYGPLFGLHYFHSTHTHRPFSSCMKHCSFQFVCFTA